MTCECAVRILGPMRTRQDSRQRPSASAQAAAIMVSIVLAVLGGMHTVWSADGSWPFDDRKAMSKVVWGDSIETFPSPAATMFVVVLMAAAALVVTGRAGLWGRWMPRWVFSVGTWTVAAVLFLRALVYGLGSIGSDAVNAAWEQRLFTPLCFTLAMLCFAVVRQGSRRAPWEKEASANCRRTRGSVRDRSENSGCHAGSELQRAAPASARPS